MAEFYSCAFNVAFNSNEDNNMELEVAFEDSDGIEVGTYSQGDDIVKLIYDVADKLDAAIAEAGDAQADVDEAATQSDVICDLQTRIKELEAENADLKDKINSIEEKPFNFKKDFDEKVKSNIEDHVAKHDTDHYLDDYFEKTYNDIMKRLKSDLPAYSNIFKGIL